MGVCQASGSAVDIRQIADVTGEVERDEGVLVIRRIHVAMQLMAPEEARETVERVHGMYAMRGALSIARCTRPSISRPLTSWYDLELRTEFPSHHDKFSASFA